MRILYFGNNWLGWQTLNRLKEQGEEIVGLVLHPSAKRKFGREMIKAAQLPPERIFDASKIHDPKSLQSIKKLRPQIGLSVLCDYLFQPELLRLFPKGVVNLHPSLLPYNRGQYPNVWSLVEGTPSGSTLHYIDEGIDTGDLIAQREVAVEPVDTGERLYRKLERCSLQLFQEFWPKIKAGKAPRIPQNGKKGSYHKTRDVEKIDEIDLNKSYRAKELIDLMRARTFPPYGGAFFRAGGKKIHLRLELLYEEDLNKEKS